MQHISPQGQTRARFLTRHFPVNIAQVSLLDTSYMNMQLLPRRVHGRIGIVT